MFEETETKKIFCSVTCYNYFRHKNKMTKKDKRKYRDKWYIDNSGVERDRRRYRAMKREKPYIVSYLGAKRRCSNKTTIYYRKGIKFLLSEEDVKYLWERDNAENMDKPSIDRVDNEGDYVLHNCRFIPIMENIKRRDNGYLKNKKKDPVNGRFI